jgi:hypothetical protein
MKTLNKLFLCLSFLIFMASCHKSNKEVDIKPDINAANDAVIATSAYDYIFNMIVKAQKNTGLQTNHVALIDSAMVVYNTGENEFVFTFSGKMCADSVRRNGKFEAEFDSSFLRPGSATIVLFDSYYDGYNLINGRDSIVYNGALSANRIGFTNYIKDGLIHKGLANNAVINLVLRNTICHRFRRF